MTLVVQPLEDRLERNNDLFEIYQSLWCCYYNIHNHEEAIKHCHQSISYLEPEQEESRALMFLNIGKSSVMLKLYDQAVEYLMRALDIQERLEKSGQVVSIINQTYEHIGLCNNQFQDYRRALKYFKKGIKYSDTDPPYKARLLGYLGNCYRKVHSYQEAIDNLMAAIGIIEENSATITSEIVGSH
jgi:tetratricopeptide (TPR) repeat protein